jgi:Tfp pilus assembly protein PilV
VSSVLHPVGPEGQGTYWRRRLVALVVLLVVVVLAALGIHALTRTTDDAAAAQGQKIDPSQVASTLTESPTGSPTVTATGTPGPTATTAGVVAPCEDGALAVTLTSNATTYGPGETPKFVLTVQNTSPVACSAEIGSGTRTVVATDAAGTQVWSTADCQASSASQVYTLDPAGSRSMSVTWSRLRSTAGCPDDQPAVETGSYTVTGTWNGVTAAPLSVALSS